MRTISKVHPNIFVLTAGLSLFLLPVLNHSDAAVKATPTTKTLGIGSINDGSVDSAVEVEATVSTITLPREGSKGPVRLILADKTGTITLVIWPDVFDAIKAQSPIG